MACKFFEAIVLCLSLVLCDFGACLHFLSVLAGNEVQHALKLVNDCLYYTVEPQRLLGVCFITRLQEPFLNEYHLDLS